MPGILWVFFFFFFVVFQFFKCQSFLEVMNTILAFVFLVLFMGAGAVHCIWGLIENPLICLKISCYTKNSNVYNNIFHLNRGRKEKLSNQSMSDRVIIIKLVSITVSVKFLFNCHFCCLVDKWSGADRSTSRMRRHWSH